MLWEQVPVTPPHLGRMPPPVVRLAVAGLAYGVLAGVGVGYIGLVYHGIAYLTTGGGGI